MNRFFRLLAAASLAAMPLTAYSARPIDTLRRSDMEFLNSPEAARIRPKNSRKCAHSIPEPTTLLPTT